MQITPEHVGAIIQINCSAKCIQIEAVNEAFVKYIRENGNRYATFEHEIEGSVIRDPDRIQEFQDNAKLGLALNAAENRALRSLLDGTATRAQRSDANSVLDAVKGMQKRLIDRINQRTERESGNLNQHRSLDSIISQASAEVKAQQITGSSTIPFEMDR